ncbi:MAG: type II toxin-antitoxin system RelE/ParE family toxin [Flavobacteriaceae bacterium]|nr:type II toxin-antitoxin system RelE/ParE family toxin [Flavobacteriaceae bacterium]
MGNYSLSGRAQFDLVGIYKYGIKMFGQEKASSYLYELETVLEELAERPELARETSYIAHSLKYYAYRAHVVFYEMGKENQVYVVRILGKRMSFIQHF